MNRKKILRHAAAGVLTAALLFSSLPVSAEEPTVIEVLPGTDNLFHMMESMLPGESVSDTIILKNIGNRSCVLFVQAQNATLKDFNDDAEALKKSQDLLSRLEMRLVLREAEKEPVLLYEGKASQDTPNGDNGVFLGADIQLGILPPGASLTIDTTVTVPAELDNRYEFVQGKFWWRFYTMDLEVPPPPDSSVPDSSSTPVSSSSSEVYLPETKDYFLKMPNAVQVEAGSPLEYHLEGFYNDSNAQAEGFTVSDILPAGLLLRGASLPAFSNGAGVRYNVVYTTNRRGMQTLHSGVPADTPFSFTMPEMPAGEQITTLSFEFGTVPPGFGQGNRIAIRCQVDDNPPGDTLVNRGMLFYTVDGQSALYSSGTLGVEIGDMRIPIAGGTGGADGSGTDTLLDDLTPKSGLRVSWAFLNLVIAFVCAVISLLHLLGWARAAREDRRGAPLAEGAQEAARPDEKETPPRLYRVLAILAGAFAVFMFAFTQNFGMIMQWVDHWTTTMAMVGALQFLLTLSHFRTQKEYSRKQQSLSRRESAARA